MEVTIMINILLICSEGMSTSLLAKKMSEAAQEKNIEVNIWAVSGTAAADNVNKADVIILGPQVRYMLSKISQLVTDKNKPVYVADMRHYGTVNGKALLEEALRRLGK